jgi:hypothetical protein
MKCLSFALLPFLMAIEARATDRFIGTGTNCSTPTDDDYDPVAGACGSGSQLIYSTFAPAFTPAVAGDNIYYRAGTYANRMALGAKAGSAGAYITIGRYQTETVTIRPTGDGHIITQNCGTGYFKFDGLIFDGTDLGDGSGVALFNCDNHHFTFSNNEMKQIPRHVLLINGEGYRVQGNKIHDNRSDCVPGRRYYGLYVATSNDVIIENNEIYNTAGGYHQIYPGPNTNVIVRNNYFHDNGYCETATFGGVIGNNSHGTQFYNNIVVNNGSAPTAGTQAGLQLFGGVDSVLIRNNTFYNNRNGGVEIVSSSNQGSALIFENNLIIEPRGPAIFVAAGGVSDTGRITSTNQTSGMITDYTVSASNFRLIPRAPCIDLGTARSGFSHHRSAPDCGALEFGAEPPAPASPAIPR